MKAALAWSEVLWRSGSYIGQSTLLGATVLTIGMGGPVSNAALSPLGAIPTTLGRDIFVHEITPLLPVGGGYHRCRLLMLDPTVAAGRNYVLLLVFHHEGQ